jgi:hypothetical protein
MASRHSKRKKRALTEESFNALLDWLSSDRESAAQRYVKIRSRLIQIFQFRGIPTAEECADEAIARVSTKVPFLAENYVGEPALFFYGVAKKVMHEYWRDGSEFEEYLMGDRDDEYVEKDPIRPEENLIALALLDNKVRAVALTADGSYRFLDSAQNLHNLVYVASLETSMFRRAVDELETLVNDSKTTEAQLQDFFERNPSLIVNDDYQVAHPHIVWTRSDGATLIPDFMLEPTSPNSLCDLLELKLPASQVFVLQKNRVRFSSAVFEACAQLRAYSEFFDEENNRNSIQRRYGLLAYKPKLFVIIGRRGDISPITRRRIETDVPYLLLKTYDDVIARAKLRLDTMVRGH